MFYTDISRMRSTLQSECLLHYYRCDHGKQATLARFQSYRSNDCIFKRFAINRPFPHEMILYDPFSCFLIPGIHFLREENQEVTRL
jgi:hypothetical protein